MKKSLVWNVYLYDYNKECFVTYNVLNHKSNILKKIKRNTRSKIKFEEELRKEMKYRFWAKSEYELYIKPLLGSKDQKIDIYDQIVLNWDRFFEYIWDWISDDSYKYKTLEELEE